MIEILLWVFHLGFEEVCATASKKEEVAYLKPDLKMRDDLDVN